MKIKFITAAILLVVITLCGCSQGNSGLNGLTSPDEVSITPTQAADLTEIAVSSVVIAENISFSAGNKTPLPIDTPEPSSSAEPPVTAKPTQVQGKSASKKAATPTPKTTPKPTVSPKQTTAPTPIATPRPTATPMSTAIPAPVPTSTPMTTPTPTATPAPPMVFFTPELQAGRTICNTCGADITGNIAAHGDGHLLNGENFSYRME